jgi:pyruvate dehydrogenase E2 component (dihydrolipoamide acetyltransferase)
MANVTMPQLGETVVEGTILKWLKSEGERVELDEPLFEISTDKVDTEVPSPVEGTLTKILVPEGQTVAVGTELAQIDAEGAAPDKDDAAGREAPATGAEPAVGATHEPPAGEAQPAVNGARRAAEAPTAEARPRGEAPPSAAEPPGAPRAPAESAGAVETPQAEPAAEDAGGAATSTSKHAGRAVAEPSAPPADAPRTGAPPASGGPSGGPRSQILSPLVRRLAGEHDVDLSRVAGTGTGGRITKADILAHIEASRAAPAAPGAEPEVAAAEAAPAPERPAEAAPAAATSRPGAAPGEEVVPLSHLRKAIAQHMVASLQTSARAWTAVEVDMEHVARLRERAKEGFLARQGFKLTYMPFVARAVTEALLAFPMVNSELRGEEIVVRHYVNLGIAVSIEGGLIVPVVPNADGMNLIGLARAINDVAVRARNRQLRPDEVHGATFSITNPGPFGSLISVPIINQPNTGILSFDAVQKRPVVVDDAIAIRHMVYLSMSWDHRTIDGALASQFLARAKEALETRDFADELAL